MLKRTLVLYTFIILSAALRLLGDDCRTGFESAEKIANGDIWSAAWADFDGDGRTDVAVITSGAHLSVLMNRGNDVFQTGLQTSLATGVLGQAFTDPLYAAEDVNGDGRPDLIFLSPNGTLIRTALGDGKGQFGPLVSSPFNPGAFRRFADVNGDGFKDFVVFDLGRVSVQLSQRDGRFAAAKQVISMPLFQSFQYAVADFDGDGYNDVYAAGVATTSGQPFKQYIWWNDGKGNFPTETDTTLSQFSAPVEMLDAWDFDGTGAAGVLLRDPQTGATQLLTAQNRTIVTRPIVIPGAIQNEGTTPVTGSGDFDADGYRDALFADGTVVWGGGTGQRIDASRFDLITDNSTSFAINTGARVADVNGDGVLDLVGTGGGNGLFAIHGRAHSRNLPGASITAASDGPVHAVMADVNGDGIADVVVDSTINNHLVATYLGDGRGGFVPAATQVLDAQQVGPFALADFDGDGKLDLLFGTPGLASDVEFGDGAGHFGSLVPFASTAVIGAGRVDSSGTNGGFLSTGTAVQLVTFGSGRTPSNSQILSIASNTSVNPADVDGDGVVDLVVDDGTKVQIFKKTGTGWTAAAQLSGLQARTVSHVVAADFDGDGRRDLLTCNDSLCDLSLATAGGYAAARQPFPYPELTSLQAITTADVDGDGRKDVIALSRNGSGTILVAHNAGGGVFDKARVVDVTSGGNVFATDTDGDGATDIVTISSKGVTVIRNGCAPSPLRLAVQPTPVYTTDRPVIAVNIESPLTSTPGPVTLREGSAVIATQTPSSWSPLADVSFTLPPLPAGSHTFTATCTLPGLGTVEEMITFDVTLSSPRRRSVHH